MAALAFQRFDQAGFFSADVGSGSGVKNDVPIVMRAEDLAAEETFRPRFVQSSFQNAVSVRELAAQIDESQMAIHSVSGNDDTLDQLMRIALDDHAILA